MRVKKKFIVCLVTVLVLITAGFLITKPFEWTDRNKTDFDDGNGGDGSFEAEVTIELIGSDGQVVEASLFEWLSGAVYQGSVSEPTGCDEGYHWDTIFGCVPDEPVTTTPPTTTPTTQPIYGDISHVKFTLEWAEVRGVGVTKNSLYVEIILTADTHDVGWCGIAGYTVKIPYTGFTFTDVDIDTWVARTKATHSLTAPVDHIKTNYWVKDPLKIRFIYYAVGTIPSGQIKSDRIITEVAVKQSSLEVSGGGGI